MIVRPITRDEANKVIAEWHSHHKPVRSRRFALAAWHTAWDPADGADHPIGVAIVGNPVAPALCDGVTFEVVRLCTDGYKNAASFLLGACWKVCKAMGVERLVSYTRADEAGTCYKAAGWRPVENVRGEAWNHGNKADRWLPGLYVPTTEVVDRVRWEVP